MVRLYTISGWLIESETPFSLLPPAAKRDAEQGRIYFRTDRAGWPTPASWFRQDVPDGADAPWLSIGRSGRQLLVRVHREADFLLDPQARTIACNPALDLPGQRIEQLLADLVMPLFLHHEGQPSFHGSAVRRDAASALVFVGASGSGKSTLAASLREPHGVACDDTVTIALGAAGARVFPSYPAARLLADSAEALEPELRVGESFAIQPARVARRPKAPVATPFSPQALRLERLYALEPTEGDPAIVSLSRRDAVIELSKHLHRLDPLDRERLSRELDTLIAIVDQVPVKLLRNPHRYEALPALHGLLAADASGES